MVDYMRETARVEARRIEEQKNVEMIAEMINEAITAVTKTALGVTGLTVEQNIIIGVNKDGV